MIGLTIWVQTSLSWPNSNWSWLLCLQTAWIAAIAFVWHAFGFAYYFSCKLHGSFDAKHQPSAIAVSATIPALMGRDGQFVFKETSAFRSPRGLPGNRCIWAFRCYWWWLQVAAWNLRPGVVRICFYTVLWCKFVTFLWMLRLSKTLLPVSSDPFGCPAPSLSMHEMH